jgi:hypothetical protein
LFIIENCAKIGISAYNGKTSFMKKILTARELAKLRNVSKSYICRLCRLPETDPKHIKNVKIDNRNYMITDEKILALYPGKYFSGSEEK